MSDEKRLKLTLAAVAVLWILALLTYSMVMDSQAQFSGKVYKIPDVFVVICQGAVGAAVAALSTSVAMAIASAYRLAFKETEGDDEDDTGLE